LDGYKVGGWRGRFAAIICCVVALRLCGCRARLLFLTDVLRAGDILES